jgi:prepilin-type N-terminal cleavage/methylation domain-containing protein
MEVSPLHIVREHRVSSARRVASRGFSLVEMLLAVFILGIGVISIGSTSTEGLAALATQWSFAEESARKHGNTVDADLFTLDTDVMEWMKRPINHLHLNSFIVDCSYRPKIV